MVVRAIDKFFNICLQESLTNVISLIFWAGVAEFGQRRQVQGLVL